MELSVLLHHRDFLRGAPLQQRGLPRYFGLTERRFAFMIRPRLFQSEFQPVTEAVSERARLNVFAFLVFAVLFSGVRRRNSFRSQRHCRFRGGRNRRQLQCRLFR
ncbi:hypothetical protein ACUN29_41665 (plasmid) [Streptomyces sp. WC2508]|uniref:hypothetical protein n=1 Tax=Streptomyces sp. WC2508 TaxID=3461405 RepID=UPI00404433D7